MYSYIPLRFDSSIISSA